MTPSAIAWELFSLVELYIAETVRPSRVFIAVDEHGEVIGLCLDSDVETILTDDPTAIDYFRAYLRLSSIDIESRTSIAYDQSQELD